MTGQSLLAASGHFLLARQQSTSKDVHEIQDVLKTARRGGEVSGFPAYRLGHDIHPLGGGNGPPAPRRAATPPLGPHPGSRSRRQESLTNPGRARRPDRGCRLAARHRLLPRSRRHWLPPHRRRPPPPRHRARQRPPLSPGRAPLFALNEAVRRGLGDDLADEFPTPPDELADAITYCDMTTGPDGQRLTVHQRLAEIHARYGPDHPSATPSPRPRRRSPPPSPASPNATGIPVLKIDQ